MLACWLPHCRCTCTNRALPPTHSLSPSAAGVDEEGELGEKKRRKVLSVIKETDVAVVVLDVSRHARWVGRWVRAEVWQLGIGS